MEKRENIEKSGVEIEQSAVITTSSTNGAHGGGG